MRRRCGSDCALGASARRAAASAAARGREWRSGGAYANRRRAGAWRGKSSGKHCAPLLDNSNGDDDTGACAEAEAESELESESELELKLGSEGSELLFVVANKLELELVLLWLSNVRGVVGM